MGLLHHAAAQADDLVGVAALGMGQGPYVAQHPLLGVLPHGAGVDDHHGGGALIVGKAVAHLGQVAPDALGVGLVLLTAVGVHKGQGGRGQGGVHGRHPGAEVLLPGDILGGNPCRSLLQSGASIGK